MAPAEMTASAKERPAPLFKSFSSPQQGVLSINIPPVQQTDETTSPNPSQSPNPRPAQRRIVSDPLSPSSPSRFSSIISGRKKDKGNSPTSPNVKSEGNALGGLTPISATTERGEMRPTRRHSNEAKMNVYTECGRHSNDWLFGGLSVTGVVKMFVPGGKKHDTQGKAPEEEGQGSVGHER